jgi:hypothetical protein
MIMTENLKRSLCLLTPKEREMKRHKLILSLAVCCGLALWPSSAHSQSAPTSSAPLPAGGIYPLTESSFAEALRDNSVDSKAYLPFYVRLTTLPMRDALIEHERSKQSNPWNVSMETPYSHVAFAAMEARRKYLPAPALSLEGIDNAHVILHVGAVSNWSLAANVEHVVIKRGQDVIQPTSKDVTPHEYHNAMNASRIVNEGAFAFPIDVFTPTATITIVIIGETHNIEIMLTPEMLKKLR